MSQHTNMDLEHFTALLDTHGANLGRWPADSQISAKRFLLGSPLAQRAHAEAVALDALLDRIPSVELSPALHARVLEIPIRHGDGRENVVWWPFQSFWRPALAMAAAAALGLATGQLTRTDATSLSDSSASLTSEDWESLSDLAFATPIDAEDSP